MERVPKGSSRSLLELSNRWPCSHSGRTRVWKDNHWYRANRSFWQSSPCLGSDCHHSITMGGQDSNSLFRERTEDFRSRFPKLKGDEGTNDCDLSSFS